MLVSSGDDEAMRISEEAGAASAAREIVTSRYVLGTPRGFLDLLLRERLERQRANERRISRGRSKQPTPAPGPAQSGAGGGALWGSGGGGRGDRRDDVLHERFWEVDYDRRDDRGTLRC